MRPLMPRTRHTVLLLLVGLIVVVETLHATSLQADTPPHVLITVDAPTAAARTALVAEGYDVWSATLEGVTLAVSPEEMRRLQSQGYEVQQIETMPQVFPPNFSGYHDYAETVTELQSLAAQYPDITSLQSIGKSLEGRELWALRITDHPDQNEPGEKGILIYGGTHAREHLTVEQALFVAHDLLDNYGHEGEATNLVNQRDIWILPNLNPDGSEYDIASGSLIWWRKNRRNNGDGYWGVDLNRNFGYKWGNDDGSSDATGAETYRGPQPFTEPENQALRDFVSSQDDIEIAISLHTYGELVLYPYGYTYAELPPDMKASDLAIFKALAGAMATRNGYTAQQASDLYIVSGDHDDWFYGVLGIYAMTIEMYPTSYLPGFYPPDSAIAPQTKRNRTALRYSIAMADDPAKSTGKGTDMTPPTVQILSPGDGANVTADTAVAVTVAVSDTVGVTTVEYLVDDQPAAVRTAPDFAATLTLAPGDHILKARAFDSANWQTLSAPVSVRAVIADTTPTPTTTPSPTASPTPTPTPTATAIPVRLYLPLVRSEQ